MQIPAESTSPIAYGKVTIDVSEYRSWRSEVDRMLNVVTDAGADGVRTGFVQSWVNTHSRLTEPGSRSAERKVLAEDIDWTAKPARDALRSLSAAVAGALQLESSGLHDDSDLTRIRASGRGAAPIEDRWFRVDDRRPEVQRLRAAVREFDGVLDALPRTK